MTRILLADDEVDFRISLAEALAGGGYDIQQCSNGDEALALLQKQTFDVVLTDLRMPGADGLEVLRQAAARMPDCILIVVTAYGSMDAAIEALRIGAHDFILKPLRLEALLRKLEMFVKHQSALAENRFLRRTIEADMPATGLVGRSEAIAEVNRLITRVASTESTVLILGETGTGKEIVARAIHRGSPRSEQPFVAINCGSIPEHLLESELFGHMRGSFTGADRDKRGLFEVAGRGTILLDEIGEMPLNIQPKILRALETREILRVGSTTAIRIAARIVAATHRDLTKMTEEAKFRSDLYYRLNVLEIRMPALREIPQDVQAISQHLLERLCRQMNRDVPVLEPEALLALEQYRWPGNVRELANVLERALILTDGPRLGLSDLSAVLRTTDLHTADDLRVARHAFERLHVMRVIAKYGDDKQKAADALGIDLSSLYRKMQE